MSTKKEKETTVEQSVLTDEKQAQPEYKEPANILTDNRTTDYNQPNLNPNSEAIKRDAVTDGNDDQYRHKRTDGKEIKKAKPFKDHEEAAKYLGKQVVVHHGGIDQVVTLESVSMTHVEAPKGFHYQLNQVSPWDGTKHAEDWDIYKGDKAYDITVTDEPEKEEKATKKK